MVGSVLWGVEHRGGGQSFQVRSALNHFFTMFLERGHPVLSLALELTMYQASKLRCSQVKTQLFLLSQN